MPDLELEKQSKTKPNRTKLQAWHVILLDDNEHSYEYVIHMMMKLFGYQPQKAFLIAQEVDLVGKVIVDTTTRERAELKQEQIHAFGADPLIPKCAGPMTAILQPAS